jgi:hypothetical protein
MFAGFLAWDEALSALEDDFYRPLSSFPLYERFDPNRVCRCVRETPYDEFCNLKFRSIDGTVMTVEEWDQYAAIQAVAQGATLQLREHHAECTSGHSEMRRGVIVKFMLGSITVRREHALTRVE